MRRLAGLLLAVMTLVVLPVVPAAAQDDRVEAVVVAEETPVGMAADGAILTAGTYAVMFEGVTIETGTVEGRYYDRGTGVHGTRHFVDAATGSTADTEVKAFVVDVDDTGTVVTYVFSEQIVASSEGVSGRGRGVAVTTLFADGSFLLETTSTVILSFG
jgi:hypothetical protein